MLKKEMPKPQSSLGFTVYVIGEQIRCQMHKLNMIKDRRYHLRKYKQCFIAKDVIDWAHRSHHTQTREEAVAAMLCLQQHGMIHHVVDEHDFKDQSLFFRFTRDDGTYAANTDVAIFYRGLDVFNRAKEAEIQRDFYHKGHLYEGAFYGNELVDCILDGDNIDRKQIVNQCRELLEYDILNHVTDDYHFSDDRLLYQFRVNFDRPSLLMDVLTPQYDQKKKKVQGNRSEQRTEQRTEQQNSEAPMFTSAGSEGSSVDDVSYNNAYDSVKHDGQRLDVTVSDAGARKGSNHGVPAINYTRRGSDDSRILTTRKVVRMEQDQVGFGFVLRGSAPCYVHTIDPWGPAAAAGLQVGQYVLTVGDQNVMHRDHRYVGRLITTHTGQLTMVVMATRNQER